MIRINVYVDEKYFNELKDLPGTISENIRFAIKEYIRSQRALNSSASASERKESE